MSKKIIEWAAREKRRSVNSAVGRNFLKSITEPVTNSDSILKKRAAVPHAAVLVNELLKLSPGDRLDSSELSARLPKLHKRRILVQLTTSGPHARVCRVIDAGLGMTRAELEDKFSNYAASKARGEKTRSLFGRGALDVLLYHEESVIYSVKDGKLSRCRLYWEKDAICDAEELGRATRGLLDSHDLPEDILGSGTVVQFRLRDGTSIPQEDQIVARLSRFYMMRLIAADPNTNVVVERRRVDGLHRDSLSYDFPIGTVLGRFQGGLSVDQDRLPVDILVARSDVPLQSDPEHIDHRENGLLFTDDNDAVLDLTLLPEYEKSPYLKHIYGVVRISGIRAVLEAKLEADEAVAVLTATRDGFDRKHELTQRLFSLVGHHVKAVYEAEEKRQKKGDVSRSQKLDRRIKEALKAINQFNKTETDDPGDGPKLPPPPPDAPLYFSVNSVHLYAGAPRRVYVCVDPAKVANGEILLFESDNSMIKIEPESEIVRFPKSGRHHRIDLKATCDVKGQKGTITAVTLGKRGEEFSARLQVLDVQDPPVFRPPENLEFTASRFSGDPNRQNTATLLVNLDAFTGMPEVTFWLEEAVGNIALGEGTPRTQVKVSQVHLVTGWNVARVPVKFRGSGWGQRATLCAKAKRRDGQFAFAKCRLKFERQPGDERFRNFWYYDLDRPVLGDVAGDILYVNSGYALHRQIFGETQADFDERLEVDPIAQMRAAAVVVEVAVYHAATMKHMAGGASGLQIDPADPIGSLRSYVEESRMKLEPQVMRALAPEIANQEYQGMRAGRRGSEENGNLAGESSDPSSASIG